ncbi:MAG: transcriptional repressor LexA [Oscillospiraceae bacterium]|nr:transcriptional repressor LexA [Oscillospiraceae bacterium]
MPGGHMTEIQREIYAFLVERSQDGVPPTIREICGVVGLKSTSSVQANLDALERLGMISRDPLHKRSIRITGLHAQTRQVPLLGTVTAGLPILATEEIERYIPYQGKSSADAPVFALHVRGDSMVNAGIFDGDIIFVEKTQTARNGEIVVALIENEATVKTFYKELGHFRLQPENDFMNPIIVDNVAILGKVVSLLRYF